MLETEEAIPLVKLRNLRDLHLYEKNSRTHSPEQLEVLAALMREYGYTNPVLVDENNIVAGHGRHAAVSMMNAMGEALKLPDGRKLPMWTIPVIDCAGWSEQQRKAYVIADNASAERAGWDMQLLRTELEELKEAGFDLALTALSDEMLELIFEPIVEERDRDPDAAPDLPPLPHSMLGDVWVCGSHRVACGDSTFLETWDRVLGSEQVDCVWTDPPYNTDVDANNKMRDRDGGNRAKKGAVENDNMTPEEFEALLKGAFEALYVKLKPGAPIYVAHADKTSGIFAKQFLAAKFKLSNTLVWRKDHFVLGRSDFQSMHEPILYGWRSGGKHRWFGGRKQTTVIEFGNGSPFEKQADGRWTIRVNDHVLVVDGDAKVEQLPGTVIFHEKPSRSSQHPTQKPVGLIEKMLTNSARAGHVIADGFGGSGSTMIAAERLGMVSRLIELKPAFVDVIVRRWQNYTGRVATNVVTGLPFPVSPDTTQAF